VNARKRGTGQSGPARDAKLKRITRNERKIRERDEREKENKTRGGRAWWKEERFD
jgi:hypothetical protein